MRAPLKPLGQRPGGLAKPRGRPFASGASHPMAVAAAARKARKATAVAEKAAARALLVQRYHPLGLPTFEDGARSVPLNQRELQVLKLRVSQALPGKPLCVAELAAELFRSESTIRKGLKLVLDPPPPLTAEEARRKQFFPRMRGKA